MHAGVLRIMGDVESSDKKHSFGRLVIPSLILSRLNMTPPRNVVGFLLIEIGVTFGYSIGVMGQIRTSASVMALIFALLMGILSVRYRHKVLLLIGLVFYSVSAIGCFLAPNYVSMLLAYSLSGIGLAMVSPMSFALVGELLPLEKRSSATGWIFAGSALSSLIGIQVIGYIAGISSWRLVFLGFVFPIALISLIVAYIGIPSEPVGSASSVSEGYYLEGFREVFSNRSAIACLIGTALSLASYQVVLTYGISFYRQTYSISPSWSTVLFSGLALCYIVGSLFSGRLVNRFGRKSLTVVGYLLLGLLTVLFTVVPVLWLSLVFLFLCLVFVGVGDSAANSLTLEQVPRFRGTMMSTYSAATSLGAALGAGLGGVLLLQYDYRVMGMVLGGFGIVSAMVYFFLAADPTRK